MPRIIIQSRTTRTLLAPPTSNHQTFANLQTIMIADTTTFAILGLLGLAVIARAEDLGWKTYSQQNPATQQNWTTALPFLAAFTLVALGKLQQQLRSGALGGLGKNVAKESFPNNVISWFRSGLLNVKMEQTEELEAYVERALTTNQDSQVVSSSLKERMMAGQAILFSLKEMFQSISDHKETMEQFNDFTSQIKDKLHGWYSTSTETTTPELVMAVGRMATIVKGMYGQPTVPGSWKDSLTELDKEDADIRDELCEATGLNKTFTLPQIADALRKFVSASQGLLSEEHLSKSLGDIERGLKGSLIHLSKNIWLKIPKEVSIHDCLVQMESLLDGVKTSMGLDSRPTLMELRMGMDKLQQGLDAFAWCAEKLGVKEDTTPKTKAKFEKDLEALQKQVDGTSSLQTLENIQNQIKDLSKRLDKALIVQEQKRNPDLETSVNGARAILKCYSRLALMIPHSNDFATDELQSKLNFHVEAAVYFAQQTGKTLTSEFDITEMYNMVKSYGAPNWAALAKELGQTGVDSQASFIQKLKEALNKPSSSRPVPKEEAQEQEEPELSEGESELSRSSKGKARPHYGSPRGGGSHHSEEEDERPKESWKCDQVCQAPSWNGDCSSMNIWEKACKRKLRPIWQNYGRGFRTIAINTFTGALSGHAYEWAESQQNAFAYVVLNTENFGEAFSALVNYMKTDYDIDGTEEQQAKYQKFMCEPIKADCWATFKHQYQSQAYEAGFALSDKSEQGRQAKLVLLAKMPERYRRVLGRYAGIGKRDYELTFAEIFWVMAKEWKKPQKEVPLFTNDNSCKADLPIEYCGCSSTKPQKTIAAITEEQQDWESDSRLFVGALTSKRRFAPSCQPHEKMDWETFKQVRDQWRALKANPDAWAKWSQEHGICEDCLHIKDFRRFREGFPSGSRQDRSAAQTRSPSPGPSMSGALRA